MNYLWLLIAFFCIEGVKAQVLTVTGVKVSITADSAATAREQALDKAHEIAFQKLLKENFPESSTLPPPEVVTNMVMNFSIDREKTTPTSYAAAFTFHFDGPQVHAWTQHQEAPLNKETLSASQPLRGGETLKMTASYTTLSEWQTVKKTLENFPGIQKVSVLAVSPQNAHMQVIYGGDIEKLKHSLLQKGWLLSPHQGSWVISVASRELR